VDGVPTPTGAVAFFVDGALITTVHLSGKQASTTSALLGVGSHTVVAVYQGDANYFDSASPAYTLVVNGP
jgi:hypothetical protein